MITKEQIERAYIKCLKDNPMVGNIDHWSFTKGAEWLLEQCPYSREDMISFGKWVWFEAHGWYRDYNAIKQFLKHWEEQK